jgi:hypothetical protein
MKNNLTKIFVTGLGLLAAVSLPAQTYKPASQNGFSDSDLNAALGIPDAWIWLQNSIVPLAMLVFFLGAVIILVELHYHQSKTLNETLRVIAELKRQSLESVRE